MDPIILNPLYTTTISHIIHVSDIHIPLYKRHDEYRAQFAKLYSTIKEVKRKFKIPESQNTNTQIIIVITGDILHSKSDLSP